MDFSERLQRLQPSATRVVAEKAAELKSCGVSVVSLSVGEPDFETPASAFEAARAAMQRGETRYSATAGIRELREEIAGYYRRRFGLSYGLDQVIVGSGAKPLLFQAFGALVDPGDEVVIVSPAWVSYVEQVRFFGGRPVIVEAAPGTLDLDVDRIRSAITDRTVAVVLNSPNNPTGRIYSEERVAAVCRLAVERDFMIVNDEVYERICFDGHDYRNPLCYVPEAAGHVLNVNAASKTYAMTGWRIGFALGPKALVKKLTSLQGHVTSGACSIAQWATVGALQGAQDEVGAMNAEYQRRKDVVVAALVDMPLIRHIPPQGAFYVFLDVRAALGGTVGGAIIEDDVDFSRLLLEQAHVATVPGTAFLQPGYIRISFATSIEQLEEGMARMKRFLEQVHPSVELSKESVAQ